MGGSHGLLTATTAWTPEIIHLTPAGKVARSAVQQHAQCPARNKVRVAVPTALQQLQPRARPQMSEDEEAAGFKDPIVVVGGGVSGIWSALTLSELGYTNVTILERELRVGGKAAAFEYDGKKYPLGAVGTPLALSEASFTESQLLEKPGRFAKRLFGGTGRRLQVLNANNLVVKTFKDGAWPTVFPEAELTAQEPVADWQRAFGATGTPERFYAHRHDCATSSLNPVIAAGRAHRIAHAPTRPPHLARAVGPGGASADLATGEPRARLVPRWGRPQTSWPLVYVSAHGYGVVEAEDAPPLYYWHRFAQKSTNAGARGPMSAKPFRGQGFGARSGPIGPKGPALRGWDSTSLFERKLRGAGVQVRGGSTVTSIRRDEREGVRVTVAEGGGEVRYEKLVLAIDLLASLRVLDADAQERELFSKVRHLPYYTVASFISLPWLASNAVYYMGDHQSRRSASAALATAGCPTILLKPNRRSNLTISWAYGGAGVGPPQMEACLRREVLRMGGTFGGVLFTKAWLDYFPHVPAEELRANFHQRLDALQGRRRTFMVGEVFNLPLVSECVDWARYLVRRHFA